MKPPTQYPRASSELTEPSSFFLHLPVDGVSSSLGGLNKHNKQTMKKNNPPATRAQMASLLIGSGLVNGVGQADSFVCSKVTAVG